MTDSRPVLPLIETSDDPLVKEEFARLAAGRGVLNLHRMMAHAPVLMQASGNMAMALRNKTKLARSTAELAILRAAQVVDCDYVWGRHVSLARAAGVTEQQLEQIARWRDSAAFTPAERLALGFAEKVAGGTRVDDEAFTAIRREFSQQEIVELTMLIAFYVSTATFINTLAVPDEPG